MKIFPTFSEATMTTFATSTCKKLISGLLHLPISHFAHLAVSCLVGWGTGWRTGWRAGARTDRTAAQENYLF